MISGIYSAATGMDAASVRHEAAAENLAHAHMPGYRRRRVQQSTFNDLLSGARGSANGYSIVNGTSVGPEGDRQIEIDFTSGLMKQTGRNLDVALGADGFFVVEGPDGPLYTRNGAFEVNSEGIVVTSADKLPVEGVNGPLQLPPNVTAQNVVVDGAGRLFANGAEFGQLQIVDFDDTGSLRPVGASLFQTGADPIEYNGEVAAGFLELSNVHHMEELVDIMIASRQYEASQKALTTMDRAIGRHINGHAG